MVGPNGDLPGSEFPRGTISAPDTGQQRLVKVSYQS